MSTFTIPTIFTAIDKMTAPIRKMAGGVQGFANKAQSFTDRSERAFRKLTPAISGAAKQFLQFASAAAISAAIVGGVMFSVKSLKDYETALASTQAVTGVTDEVFKGFKAEINSVAATTKKSSVEIAQAFELVGSAKPELLASAEGLGAVTKASVILSKASRDDLSTSVENLTGVMNQFGLGAEQAERTINTLSAGAKVGSASISDVGLAMKNFGSVASGANLSLEQSVAMVEVLGKFSVKGAEAGTKLRGSLLKLQQAGVGYASGQFEINDALAEAKKKIDSLGTSQQKDAALLKMFGADNISTGKILLNNIGLFEEYTKGVTNTNTANEMAAVNSNTLSVKLEEMKAAWVNLITGSDGANSSLETAKNTIAFLTDNLDTIVSVGSKILLFFAAWKVSILAARAGLLVYNVALGVSSALSSTASIAVGANTTALAAYNFMSKIVTASIWLWTGAQKVLNFIMNMNPISLIIIAIVALVAAILWVVNSTEGWGEQWDNICKFMAAQFDVFVLNLKIAWGVISYGFMAMVDGIVMAWKGAMNAIGVLSDEQYAKDKKRLEIEGLQRKVAIMANVAKLQEANEIANNSGLEWKIRMKEEKELINPKVTEQEGLSQRLENTTTSNVNLNVNDPNKRATVQAENLPPNVKIGTTVQ